jgi:hypothetical protein
VTDVGVGSGALLGFFSQSNQSSPTPTVGSTHNANPTALPATRPINEPSMATYRYNRPLPMPAPSGCAVALDAVRTNSAPSSFIACNGNRAISPFAATRSKTSPSQIRLDRSWWMGLDGVGRTFTERAPLSRGHISPVRHTAIRSVCFMPRTLSDEDVDALAQRIADKLRAQWGSNPKVKSNKDVFSQARLSWPDSDTRTARPFGSSSIARVFHV